MVARIAGKPLYLDAEDTCEALDISKRQLKYWEEKKLLEPELGAGRNRYTEGDLERLQVIRQLIVDWHLPVDFVEKLLSGGTLQAKAPAIPTNQYLDFNTGTVTGRQELADRFWSEFGATAELPELLRRLKQLALLSFRVMAEEDRSPEFYAARRNELMEDLRKIDLVARLEARYEFDEATGQYNYEEWETVAGLQLAPRLSDDDESPYAVSPVSRDLAKAIADCDRLLQDVPKAGGRGLRPWVATLTRADEVDLVEPSHWEDVELDTN